MLFKF